MIERENESPRHREDRLSLLGRGQHFPRTGGGLKQLRESGRIQRGGEIVRVGRMRGARGAAEIAESLKVRGG